MGGFFHRKNIQHAFAKPGIWPVDGADTIAAVTKPLQVKSIEEKVPSSPKNALDIRRIRHQYEKDPSTENKEALFDLLLKQTAKVSILQNECAGLREAIILEKRKRKRGKKLNLAGEVSQGVEIYSPGKVVAAREYQAHLDEQAAIEEARKEQNRIRKAANKLLKEKLAEEKAQRDAAKQLQKEMKATLPPIPKAVLVGPKKTALKKKAPVLKTPKVTMANKSPQKKQKPKVQSESVGLQMVLPEIEHVHVSRLGRQINLPQRFRSKE